MWLFCFFFFKENRDWRERTSGIYSSLGYALTTKEFEVSSTVYLRGAASQVLQGAREIPGNISVFEPYLRPWAPQTEQSSTKPGCSPLQNLVVPPSWTWASQERWPWRGASGELLERAGAGKRAAAACLQEGAILDGSTTTSLVLCLTPPVLAEKNNVASTPDSVPGGSGLALPWPVLWSPSGLLLWQVTGTLVLQFVLPFVQDVLLSTGSLLVWNPERWGVWYRGGTLEFFKAF